LGKFPSLRISVGGRERRSWLLRTMEDRTAKNILERLRKVARYPRESLAPFEEFFEDGKTYYFTPGGFLYRKDPGTEEIGGFFCGYLTDEVWRHRHDGG
jgi:hypothetical protein